MGGHHAVIEAPKMANRDVNWTMSPRMDALPAKFVCRHKGMEKEDNFNSNLTLTQSAIHAPQSR